MCRYGAVVKPRHPAGRGARTQPGRGRGGALSGRVRPGGRIAPRRSAGCAGRRLARQGCDGSGIRTGRARGGSTERAQCGVAGHRPLHRRRQRGASGHKRSGGGGLRDPRAPGGSRHSGRAAAQEPRLPQRHDRARAGRIGGSPLAASFCTAVTPLRQQSQRTAGRFGRDAGCGVLAAADARAGGVPRLRRDPGGAGSGRGRGDRSARSARPHGLDGLAGRGRGRRASSRVESPAARDR